MRLKALLLAMTAAFTLTACGGGDDNNNAGSDNGGGSSTPGDQVSQASQATATALGATAVTGTTSTAQAYDLVASIGDTWRVVLNNDGTYTLTVLQTAYAIEGFSGQFSSTTNGSFTLITEKNGLFSLLIDTRTHTIAGTVTVQVDGTPQVTGVAGTGYAVSDFSKLAGTYFFLAGGTAPGAAQGNFFGGSFTVSGDGKTVQLCEGSQIDSDGMCVNLDDATRKADAEVASIVRGEDGLFHLVAEQADLGAILVQAGDRGPVVVFDLLKSVPVYAARQVVLQGTEATGTWVCTDAGKKIGTLTVNGTAMHIVTAADSDDETLNFNKVNTDTKLVSVNGIITSVANGENPVESGVLILPLSSSLMVAERDEQHSLAVCQAQPAAAN